MQDLNDALNKLADRVQTVEKAKDALQSPLNDNRKLLYQEAGQWARHYSTIRMAVTTLAITTCAGVIALKWNGNASSEYVWNVPIVLWLLAFLVFHAFTYQTYKMFNHQLFYRAVLPHGIEKKEAKLSLIIEDSASIIIWLMTLVFGVLAFIYGGVEVFCPLKFALVVAAVGGFFFALIMDSRIKTKLPKI